MDYLGWELDRQRAALAALLLGGGENGIVRDEERRSPAGYEAGETAGRYAGISGKTGDFDIPEAGEAVRAAGRLPERTGRGAKAQKNEEPLARRASGEEKEAAFRRIGLAEDAPPLSGGTGAQGKDFSTEETARQREPAAERPAETKSAAEERTRAGERSAERDGIGTPRVAGISESEGGAFRRVQAGGPTGLFRRNGTAFPVDGGGAGTAEIYELPGPVPAWGGGAASGLQAEADARELSRAVQRDARRYDGGFTIY